MILTVLGIIIGVILLYLAVIIFFPVFFKPRQPIQEAKLEPEAGEPLNADMM